MFAKAIFSTVRKVRTWGLRGVCNFFRGKVADRRLRRAFRRNLADNPCDAPEKGITIIADLRGGLSLSKAMRDFAFSLRDAGIPFQTFHVGGRGQVRDADVQEILTPRPDFRLGRYTHIVDMLSSPLPENLRRDCAHVVFWEFGSGLLEAFPKLAGANAVIAMSDFNAAYFRRALPGTTKVRKILYPLRLAAGELEDAASVRSRYGIGREDFAVFFNFDYGSSFFRKNPDGAMRAFAAAFPGARGVRLVFKTNRRQEHRREHAALRALAGTLGIADRFTSIDDYIPQRDLYSLANACDVYLSLHRGEGFGLGVAEAMSFGKPVVATDYSATTEFCNSSNSLPVPYEIRSVQPGQMDHPCYLDVTEYAEPDVGAAAAALRRLYEDPALRRRLGDEARAFLAERFSVANFRRSVEAYLDS